MKILFIVHSTGLQILDTQEWNGRRITEMDDNHIHNAMLYCHTRAQSEDALNCGNMSIGGFTYKQWIQIFQSEKARRESEKRNKRIQELKAERAKLNPFFRRLQEIAEELQQLNSNRQP